MSNLTPAQIVSQLDQHIIGQSSAKRAVAIALRNRWRRMQLAAEMRAEIAPKNIMMIGPTGVGKTEIARRLAKLSNAPFIKIEATKFTEVGYVGRDVESIIRDLVETAIKMLREQAMERGGNDAADRAEDRILDALLPPARGEEVTQDSSTRQTFRKKLREGDLDDKEIDIEMSATPVGVEIMAPPGMEEMTSQLQNMFSSMGQDRKKTRKIKIKDARKQLQDEEASQLIKEDDIKQQALEAVEQNGIVFLDEIDKIAKKQEGGTGGDVSREGVQRDLLPLIEGCTVSTKYGMVKTDHILFITSGAFHLAKPSDLIPELQGRLPIRVELNALKPVDFARILTEPNYSLTEQYQALLGVEGINLEFSEDGVTRLAELAFEVNENTENIGARRLHTLMERLLEDLSYEANHAQGAKVVVNQAYVEQNLQDLVQDQDLSQYIL